LTVCHVGNIGKKSPIKEMRRSGIHLWGLSSKNIRYSRESQSDNDTPVHHNVLSLLPIVNILLAIGPAQFIYNKVNIDFVITYLNSQGSFYNDSDNWYSSRR
jgi:hypothetical protein